jgi:glycerate kinase
MIDASFGWIGERRVAIVEMADASGLRLLRTDELCPLKASSRGTGELIRAALDLGAKEIAICVGGSATVDGGVGLLQALGVRFLNDKGCELSELPQDLVHLDAIDLAGLDPRLSGVDPCRITVFCDVDNMLLGSTGAAAVFGPQKGATPDMVVRLEDGLRQLALVAGRYSDRRMETERHGGAAGGAAAGLFGLLDARLVNGIERFLDITDFDLALAEADWVITGEGSIDEQTLNGKGPYGIALRAKLRGIPVVALAGRVPRTGGEALNDYFDGLFAIGDGPADLASALAYTGENLRRMGRQIGNMLAVMHNE